MRMEPTGRGSETVEVWEGQARCDGCGTVLAYPHVHLGWVNCDCAGGQGHATKRCLECDRLHHDPPCSRPGQAVGNAYGY